MSVVSFITQGLKWPFTVSLTRNYHQVQSYYSKSTSASLLLATKLNNSMPNFLLQINTSCFIIYQVLSIPHIRPPCAYESCLAELYKGCQSCLQTPGKCKWPFLTHKPKSLLPLAFLFLSTRNTFPYSYLTWYFFISKILCHGTCINLVRMTLHVIFWQQLNYNISTILINWHYACINFNWLSVHIRYYM